MSIDTLILDRNWRPAGFCSWQNAVKLWYEGVAQVIKEDESGKVLRSKSFTMGMPRVIVVKNEWSRRRRDEVPLTRRNIATRDNSECQYCGRVLQTQEYTLDHVIPRSQGGLSTWDNLVLACVRCNKYKAGNTLAESGMKLLAVPKQPKRNDPKFNFKLHIHKLRPEWKEWSSWLYWNVALEK
jgi:5-methylcytosine-specific restriction endonuclease McrA